MSTESIGPTGKFPHGKIAPNDGGELNVSVGTVGDKVEVQFGTWVNWLGMTADQARTLAAGLVEAAAEIEGKRK